MAIFNKIDDGTTSSTSETTIIASGATIKGEFIFDSMLHVDGSLDGTISSKSMIVIGKKGTIKGELRAEKLVVNGTFEGNADCANVEILAGGVFTGNVVSKELMIEAKARFEGKSSIRKSEPSLLKDATSNFSSAKKTTKHQSANINDNKRESEEKSIQ